MYTLSLHDALPILRRAKFKPGRRLRVYFDALVHIPGSEGHCPRPIAVTWRVDGEADRRQGGGDLAEGEARRDEVAAPFRLPAADLRDCGMIIQVSPIDA